MAIVIAMPFMASARLVTCNRILVFGSVTINGTLAPIDTVVTAEVDGREVGSADVKNEPGKYQMTIRESEVAKGTAIDFKINGLPVERADKFVMTDCEDVSKAEYNLSFNGTVKGATDTTIEDGDIIQCKTSANPNAVYIVKIVNGKKYIRHIVSLQIFNSYRHLKWTDLIQVQSLDGFTLSGWARVNTGAAGAPGQQDRVFEINDDQTKHWIDMTAAEFLLHGGKDEAIYSINDGELGLYKEGAAVKLK